MSTLILVGGLLGLLLLGIPVAFALLVSSLALILYEGTLPVLIMAQRLSNALDSFPLLAIPLFILAAEIMNHSGATERIFRLTNTLLGRIPGGLGHVNVAASMLFSGMSGSAVADAAGLGAIEIKAMKEQGYSSGFAAAVTAASSTIGPIIPPSVPIVLYGVISGTAIGDLFLAGFLPGILMGLSMMVYIAVIAKRRNFPRDAHFAGMPAVARATREALPSLLLPVIILGGIWGGVFSPTEAAAAAVLYSLLLGLVVHRSHAAAPCAGDLPRSGLLDRLDHVHRRRRLHLWLAGVHRTDPAGGARLAAGDQLGSFGAADDHRAGAAGDGHVHGTHRHPDHCRAGVPACGPGGGIDPIHFGIVTVLTLMIGLLTPPFGLNLFIVQRVSGAPFAAILKEVWPFIVILIALLVPIILLPQISLFLVEVF